MRLALLLPLALLLAGCPKPTRTSAERLASPTAGNLRLITARVKETPELVHYQWSLLGERNWTTPSVSEGRASLSEVYKLNDPSKSGGCHTWLCDLTLTKQAQGTDWKWELRLHGSNDKTATESGTAAGTPKILVPNDQDIQLPAELTLAKLGEKNFTLSAPK